MNNKIFESNLNIGYRFFYVPYFISGVIFIIWLAKFLVQYKFDMSSLEGIGYVFWCAILIEFILSKILAKKRSLKLFGNLGDLNLEIIDDTQRINFNPTVMTDKFWSYNQNLDKEEKIEMEGNEILRIILFLKLNSSEEEELILLEDLEPYEDLPKDWNYKNFNLKNYNQGIKVYKLDVLIQRMHKLKLMNNGLHEI